MRLRRGLAAFLGVSLAAALAKFALDDWLPLRANLRAEVDASDEAIDQLLAMPQRAFERHDAGHFLNVVNGAAFGYGAMAVYLDVNAVGYAIAVAALLGCAAAIDLVLVPVFLCGLVVYFAVNWVPMHSAGRLLMEMMPAREAWQEEARRLVEEKRAANAGGAEGFYERRFEGCTNAYRAFLRRHRLADTVQTTLPAAVSPALQVVVLAVCAALWAAGQVSLGSVVAAWQLFSLLQTPMAGICTFVSFYVANRPNLALLREHAEEAAEPSGFEALATGEKDLVARVGRHPLGDARARRGRQAALGGGVRGAARRARGGEGHQRLGQVAACLTSFAGSPTRRTSTGVSSSRRGCSTRPTSPIPCPW